jgi:hypothetical protein
MLVSARLSETNGAQFNLTVQGAQRRSEKGDEGVVPIMFTSLAAEFVGRGSQAHTMKHFQKKSA